MDLHDRFKEVGQVAQSTRVAPLTFGTHEAIGHYVLRREDAVSGSLLYPIESVDLTGRSYSRRLKASRPKRRTEVERWLDGR